LGISLTVLFSQFLKNMFVYVSNSKLSKLSPVFAVVVFLLFIPTMILPSIIYTQDSLAFTPEKEVVDAMVWLKNNTESGSVILASLDNGHLITYFADRKNVFDPYFLLVKDINTRVDEVGKIYSSSYETDAIELLNKYDVDYIFLSSFEKSDYNILDISYKGKRCFQLVYDKDVKIYRSLCELVER